MKISNDFFESKINEINIENFIDGIEKNKNLNNFQDVGKIFKDTINNLSEIQKDADIKINKFLNGNENLHNVLFSLEKAKFYMNLSVKVRDKIIEAYQNIMRMQI